MAVSTFPIQVSNSENNNYLYAKVEFLPVLHEIIQELWQPRGATKARPPAKAIIEACLGYISNPATNEILNKLGYISDSSLETDCYYPRAQWNWTHLKYKKFYLEQLNRRDSHRDALKRLLSQIFLVSGNPMPLTSALLKRMEEDQRLSFDFSTYCKEFPR